MLMHLYLSPQILRQRRHALIFIRGYRFNFRLATRNQYFRQHFAFEETNLYRAVVKRKFLKRKLPGTKFNLDFVLALLSYPSVALKNAFAGPNLLCV